MAYNGKWRLKRPVGDGKRLCTVLHVIFSKKPAPEHSGLLLNVNTHQRDITWHAAGQLGRRHGLQRCSGLWIWYKESPEAV